MCCRVDATGAAAQNRQFEAPARDVQVRALSTLPSPRRRGRCWRSPARQGRSQATADSKSSNPAQCRAPGRHARAFEPRAVGVAVYSPTPRRPFSADAAASVVENSRPCRARPAAGSTRSRRSHSVANLILRFAGAAGFFRTHRLRRASRSSRRRDDSAVPRRT